MKQPEFKLKLTGRSERKGIKFKITNRVMSFSELIGPLFEITNDDEMKEYFDAYAEYVYSHGHLTKEAALNVAKSNVGYFAGYYSVEQRMRVERVLNLEHPILGKAIDKEYTPDELIKLGLEMARKIINTR